MPIGRNGSKTLLPLYAMLTLYQKPVGYGLLILLLITGWNCQNASPTSGKRKATIAQRFEKPAKAEAKIDQPVTEPATSDKPKVISEQPVTEPASPVKRKATIAQRFEKPNNPEVTADPSYKKATLLDQHTTTSDPPTQQPVITVPSEISTPRSQLDLEFAIEQFKANQFEVAEYYLKKSLMASPDNPQTIRFLPWAYFFQKRYDKALTAFESAHTHFPREAEPLIGMGWSYVAMKFYERALGKFKQAESLSPDSYEVHKGLGFCNLFLAREKAAQFHFKKIYLFGERDDLEEQWDQWRQGLPDKP
ncbi:MAG: hypothetical protein OEM27_02950, partial [Nitrospinota bacterium]|nr:hypothetical protein [Nitrospinota bacterium]